ncbi:MAG: hypothetical protein AAFP99_02105 [Pseudomonadota bacterium]
MATGPRKRASGRSTRKPVTIDLDAKRVEDEMVGEAADAVVDPGSDANVEHAGDAETASGDASDRPTDQTDAGDAEQTNSEDNEKEREPIEATAPPPPPPPSPPLANASGGRGGAVTGGVIGGLLALLGGAGLQWTGVLPSLAPAPAIEMPEPVDLSPLTADIEALRQQLNSLPSEPASVEIPAELVAQVETAAAKSDENASTLASLNEQLVEARETLTTVSSAISGGEAGDGAALEVVNAQITALTEQVGGIETQIAELAAVEVDLPDIDFAPIETRIGEVEGTLSSVGERADAIAGDLTALREETTGRFDAVEQSVASLGEQVAAGGADSTAVARAFAASSLQNAVDRGGAFATELEAYSTVAADGVADDVSTLRDYAASGVPTVTQLSEGFPVVANAIIAAGQGLDGEASMADRLMASARGLVQVRPVGEVEGDTPGAVAARIEQRLRAADLATALEEWDALPDAAKTASQGFADEVRARQTVDMLIANILTGAMAAAGGSGTTSTDDQ